MLDVPHLVRDTEEVLPVSQYQLYGFPVPRRLPHNGPQNNGLKTITSNPPGTQNGLLGHSRRETE